MLGLRGETVTVWRPVATYNERMDPIDSWEPEDVDNVLFGRPTTEQAIETMRAYGVQAAYVLGIPKAYTASLRGCVITRRRDEPPPTTTTTMTTTTGPQPARTPGEPAYKVAGDPQPLPPELCPTDWNREAIVGFSDG